MTRHEFAQRTRASIDELLRVTSSFINDDTEGKEIFISIVKPRLPLPAGTVSVTFDENATDVEGLIDHTWNAGTFSEQIPLVVHRVEVNGVVIRAFPSFKFIDDSDAQWQQMQAADTAISPFLPYYLRLPTPSSGWKETDDAGRPDMQKSLSLHGRYCLDRNA